MVKLEKKNLEFYKYIKSFTRKELVYYRFFVRIKMENRINCSSCSSKEYGVFKCASPTALDKIYGDKSHLQFKKKDIIFKEHEKMNGFYCIQTGVVRTYKTSASGKEQTFQIAGRCKWLGFRDLISGEESNHSSICLEDVEVCFIPKETITHLIKSDADFQIEVMKYLADEWKDMENHVHSMGTKQIHSRLAELLITFHGASGGTENELNINVTREVMATCIGTTTETLIRALADFKDRNWIRVEKNKIELINLKALYNISEATTN